MGNGRRSCLWCRLIIPVWWRWFQIHCQKLMDLKLISWNTRGMNAYDKMVALKNLVLDQKCDVCMVQETKIMKMNQLMDRQIWYDTEFDWDYMPSTGTCGSSGGRLTIWNRNKLLKEDGRMRDVNAVRCDEERNIVEGDSRNKDFHNNFINIHELVDFPLSGGAYTWSDMQDFLKKVEEWWGIMKFQGIPSFVFFKKLQNLKYFLKNWSREEFSGVKKEKAELTEKIGCLD
ncbi:uncharacterized protein LOC113279588 [Papaver somniferum]|uniref:uncharacterized protein LOC113279588 n=1 Tax=Papaver somniferum TaxID=3469 RepID=UPI000E6FBFD1|nr:uncharacterized protein LOC113279588 [Papaver somniferum]